jgi:Glycosyl hydrolase family 57
MNAERLRLFAFFHLNLAYSSIEEEQRPDVVRRCYWPLLKLARAPGVPIGIEASAYTLECIQAIDPAWVDELCALCSEGRAELIGSGYAQLIGPLVPPEVNAANLRLGNQHYQELLGMRPAIALINEQAYSAGLLQHYIDAGFRAIIMEWDNPARWHAEWPAQWRYLPQIARGQHGEEIPLIWNKSIAFQKFQRLVHGEMEFEEYLKYLEGHLAETPRAFPIYGNDVEVFDFRPGRYHTEPKLEESGEWKRIAKLFEILRSDGSFHFILPSGALELANIRGAGNRISLESADDPVPVKKQEKYNITRWAVTGRNDLGINTACHRLYEAIKVRGDGSDNDTYDLWRELCYVWSSDFRTHITERRWSAYRERLAAFEKRLKVGELKADKAPSGRAGVSGGQTPSGFRVEREGRFLKVESDLVSVTLNVRRGLAIDSFVVKNVSAKSLLGTLPHGYYEDIALGADFYSGHLVLETPGRPKITDLSPVEPKISGDGDDCVVEGEVATPLGTIRKRIRISGQGELGVEYELMWQEMPAGSLRLAHITLNPQAFDLEHLFFEGHNGGYFSEKFQVGTRRIEHGRPVSFLVSASAALGMTNGKLAMGDGEHAIRVHTNQEQACVVAQIAFVPVASSYFYRASFSAAELDETCRGARTDFPRIFSFAVSAAATRARSQPEIYAAQAKAE